MAVFDKKDLDNKLQKKEILISIVIPVKNGASWLDDLLPALGRQALAEQTEVICIDSGSEDRSVDIIKKHGARLIQIPSESFNHGATRNLGAREAQGEFVVMTVQDAKPADDQWLQKLLEGFVDEQVAGVCGQQIVPHERDKNPVRWFRPVSDPKLEIFQFGRTEDFDSLSGEEKKEICGWDDVNACYRREVLLKVPFRETNFSEDAAWAMDALRAGYKIAYNKIARVYHYHHEDPDFVFRRALTVFYHRYKLFAIVPARPELSFRNKLSRIKLLMNTPIPFSEKIKWWRYNMVSLQAQQRAHSAFSEALKVSEEELDRVHQKYCKKSPQAKPAEPLGF